MIAAEPGPITEPDEPDIGPEGPDDEEEPEDELEELDDEELDDQLVIAHEHESDRRRQRRQEAAAERIAELTAMRRLVAEHGVQTRSRRQADSPDPRIHDLPWVGDIAERYGIEL